MSSSEGAQGPQSPLAAVEAQIASVGSTPDAQALEALRVALLGRKGALKALMGELKALPKQERREFGQRVNVLKREATEAIARRKTELELAAKAQEAARTFDVTLPGRPTPRGSRHPLTIVTEELLEVFQRLGFQTAHGPEVEEPFFNFEALNIPADHPAREPEENFYLQGQGPRGDAGAGELRLLRSQTSTVQIRVMFDPEGRREPPFRIVAPGRVFRPDTVDATHHFQFHQIEGLAVAEGISFRDLKTILHLFAQAMFGPDEVVRLRPSYFPFTEPSAEVDFRCWICHGPGCAVCKQTGWIELGGCGMVDPNVLQAVGIDSERYTGYAFGLGIERLAMLRYGIRDIRLFTENDVRFLDQLGV